MLAGAPVSRCIPLPCFFFQKETTLRFFGGWGYNLLLAVLSNTRFGKKQRPPLILNELLGVPGIKPGAVTRASNNKTICNNSNKDKNLPDLLKTA